MIEQNIQTLKIHSLSKAQYEREFAADRLDPTALYLTPYEEEDLGSEKLINKVNVLDEQSTHNQYPSARCVYELIGNIQSVIDRIDGIVG